MNFVVTTIWTIVLKSDWYNDYSNLCRIVSSKNIHIGRSYHISINSYDICSGRSINVMWFLWSSRINLCFAVIPIMATSTICHTRTILCWSRVSKSSWYIFSGGDIKYNWRSNKAWYRIWCLIYNIYHESWDRNWIDIQ